jgi:hypothetical protein
VSGTVTQAVDLGRGVETTALSGQFWEQVPGVVRVDVDAEAISHDFSIEGGRTVFSTSGRLSKLVIAAKRGGADRRRDLPGSDGQRRVGYGRIPSDVAALACQTETLP